MVIAWLSFRGDGRKYVGGWLHGKQDGRGVYTNIQGNVIDGLWKEGKRVDIPNPDSNAPADLGYRQEVRPTIA
jgi:hypothetical protein